MTTLDWHQPYINVVVYLFCFVYTLYLAWQAPGFMHQNYTRIYIPWGNLCVLTKFLAVITIGFFCSQGSIWVWECILDSFSNCRFVVCSQWSSLLAFALLLVVRWRDLPLSSRSWRGAVCNASLWLVTVALREQVVFCCWLLRGAQRSGNDAGSWTARTPPIFLNLILLNWWLRFMNQC